jgi:hypothetical protein
LKHAEGKILNRKMRIGWDVDERFEWHSRNCRAFLRNANLMASDTDALK